MTNRPQISSNGRLRASHETLINELDWSSEPSNPANDSLEMYIDSFWVSQQNDFGTIEGHDAIRQSIITIADSMESEINDINTMGGHPFFKYLYYSTSSLEELKREQELILDTPLMGGFIVYEEALDTSAVDGTVNSTRTRLEEALSSKHEGLNIIWGYTGITIQFPNVIYFGSEGRVVVAEDIFPKRAVPHSLFTDYGDILFSEERPDPDREIKFFGYQDGGEYRREIVNKVRIGDIDIQFGVIDQSRGQPEVIEEFKIPLTSLHAHRRIPYSIRLNNRVK